MMEIKTILLVDDDPNIRSLARVSLERLGGWTVTMASSGAEALTLLQTAVPDLIILDVLMPELDGLETLSRIRKMPGALAGLPVILMTAAVNAQQTADYKNVGAIGVIAKPFDPLKLAGNVKELLAVGGA